MNVNPPEVHKDFNTDQLEQLKQICRTQNEMIKSQAMRIHGIQNDMSMLKQKMQHLEKNDNADKDHTLRDDVEALKTNVRGIKDKLTNLLTSKIWKIHHVVHIFQTLIQQTSVDQVYQ